MHLNLLEVIRLHFKHEPISQPNAYYHLLKKFFFVEVISLSLDLMSSMLKFTAVVIASIR
jgi:hypothetical protein